MNVEQCSHTTNSWFTVAPGTYRLQMWGQHTPDKAGDLLRHAAENQVPAGILFSVTKVGRAQRHQNPIARPTATASGSATPIYTYLEYIQASPATKTLSESEIAELCQYSLAVPVDVPGVLLRCTDDGSITRIDPKVPRTAIEIHLPPPPSAVAKHQSRPLGMWYSIILYGSQKWRTNAGLDTFGKVLMSPNVVRNWVAQAKIMADQPITAALEQLIKPLGNITTYEAEVRNVWQNLVLAYAVTRRRVKGDCEDMALAAYTVLQSVRKHAAKVDPGLCGIDWPRCRPFMCSGWYCRSGESREAHMWCGVVDHNGRWHFLESVIVGAYAATVNKKYIGVRVFFEDSAGWLADENKELFPHAISGRPYTLLKDSQAGTKVGVSVDYPSLTMPTEYRIGVPIFKAQDQQRSILGALIAGRDWVAAPPLPGAARAR